MWFVTSDTAPSDPRQAAHEHDARRFVVLLHEALLGENLEDLLHAHVLVDDLLHNTLQNSVVREDLEDLDDDLAAATIAPPALPAQEPTLGLLGAALQVGRLTTVSSVQAWDRWRMLPTPSIPGALRW